MSTKKYDFNIPEHWYRDNPELWCYESQSLGKIGGCIEDHEEWAESAEAIEFYEETSIEVDDVASTPLHMFCDDLIVECQKQVIRFSEYCRQEIGNFVLLTNAEVGRIVDIEFYILSDEERKEIYENGFPLSFIGLKMSVQCPSNIYEDVRDYDVRLVDDSSGNQHRMVCSTLMINTQRTLRRFIWEEENRIVSLEDWKKKKGLS